jgi:hypothetical protein
MRLRNNPAEAPVLPQAAELHDPAVELACHASARSQDVNID